MSTPEAVDAVAFEELEQLVRALGEELGRFRKRAIHAESRLKQLESSAGSADLFSGDRISTLEGENRDLHDRLTAAAERTRAMLERVRFLRQQTTAGNEA
jgi:predicted  nucleic acid-binding Zn-ribbon protein